MTSVGAYNRYWTTSGGAETYGAAMAQVLARTRSVELLGPDPIDIDELARQLRLDLTGIGFRLVKDRPDAVSAASADYDLFVNVSFLSAAAADDDVQSVYVVHFPAELDADLTLSQRVAMRVLGPIVRRARPVDTAWGKGFYPREGGRPRYFWTNGDARFVVSADPVEPIDVRLVFARQRPPGMAPVGVSVLVDGVEAAHLVLQGDENRLQRRRGVPVVVTVPADPHMGDAEIRIVSDTFVPAELAGGDDDRALGVALTALHTGIGLIDRLGAQLGSWFPVLHRPPGSLEFLDTYDHVVCNSAFTRHWLQEWWEHDGAVLHPPVRMHDAGQKEPIILSVGRFFGAASGHSKKQLELVRAFGDLLDRGVEGWTLHLVGGCGPADEEYLESVRAAAADLPVEFHVNAPGDELEDLYARASIFWHATGLGEDPDVAPHRLEHFGIATVEAMSAGVVPVAIGLAGQLETVEHGRSGYHWQTPDELVDRTVELVDDPELLQEMSDAARTRAETFSLDEFAEKLEALLAT